LLANKNDLLANKNDLLANKSHNAWSRFSKNFFLTVSAK
jgi:hypothetical protein